MKRRRMRRLIAILRRHEAYAYKTTDYGKTWTALPAQESGVRGFAHVIKEDSVKPELLFLGTEFGLWISIDGGQHWAQYKGSNSRRWRWMISRCRRARAIWCWRRTGAEFGSSMTFVRSTRLTP